MFGLLLCFAIAVGYCNGFATSKEFAIFLPIFGDTKFHDVQISTALCFTQYNFLQRNYGLNGPKPFIYDPCPYLEWSYEVDGLLYVAYDLVHLEAIKLEFETGVDAPDLQIKMIPTEHFDLEEYISKTNLLLLTSRQNIIKAIQAPYPSFTSIRIALGTMIHTLQDFYSHTNWVELGNKQINVNIGINELLGVNINGGTSTACKPCVHNFTDTEQRAIDFAYSNYGNRLYYFGKENNIYSCIDNLATNYLTSGYHSKEAKYTTSGTFPNGKCSHGGLSDDFAPINPTGGISKDAASVIFAPHYHLHRTAADLSVQATIRYLDDLRISLDDEELFGKLIGFDAASTMSIMIDTTGSMTDSIDAVKKFAQKMVIEAANKTSKFFMTPFNDPYWGPVLSFTNASNMVAYIGTLTADGGGDTPEKCYSALLDTVRAVPQGTNIYIFTDANSKNPELYPIIVSLANQKSLHISFMMSGENVGFLFAKKSNYKNLDNPLTNNKFDDEGGSTTSIEDYRKLTIATDGQYLLSQLNELDNVTAAITDTNWQMINILTNVMSPMNSTFYIDKSIVSVEISLSSSTTYLNNFIIDIIDANDESVINKNGSNIIVNNDFTKIYRFNTTSSTPAASPWTLMISEGYNYIDQITIRVQSSLITNLMLVNSETQIPLNGSPLSMEDYDIYVICEQCTNITDIGVTSCGDSDDNGGSSMISQIPKKAGNINWWSVQNITLPSNTLNNQICIIFSGNIYNGTSTFYRTAQQKLSISSLSLETSMSTANFNNSGHVYPNNTVIISYSVTNIGNLDDYFTISVTSSIAFKVNFTSGNILINANDTVTGEINIIANNTIGTISNVEISVASVNDPSQYNVADFTVFIVDPNPDVNAPVCKVLNTTVSNCPKEPNLCQTADYDAELSFSDIGTGVYRVAFNDGTWNVEDSDMFNNTNAANHTFYANGIISCCNNTQFSVIDGASLVGQCIIEVTYPLPTSPPPLSTTTITTTTTTKTAAPTTTSNASIVSISLFMLLFSLILTQ